MERTTLMGRLCGGIAMLVCMGASPSASANVITFLGTDHGVGVGAPRPNSQSAYEAFRAAIGSRANTVSTVTFEGQPADTQILPSSPVDLGLGVKVGSAGGCCIAISATDSTVNGFNTTSGGSKHLELHPNSDTFTDEITAVFSFAFPVNSFGLFLTGSQNPGPGGCGSSCGAPQLWNGPLETIAWLPENDIGGGVAFFGFIDSARTFRELTLILHGPYAFGADLDNPDSEMPDIMGVDDVIIARVPAPPTQLLVALVMAVTVFVGRRPAG